MRKHRKWLIVAMLVLLVGYGCLHEASRSLRRTVVYNARLAIGDGYSEFQRTGKIPEPKEGASFQEYTNILVVAGTEYKGALAMKWPTSSGGIFIMTTNRTTIWLDNNRGPKVVDDSYRAPLFCGGL